MPDSGGQASKPAFYFAVTENMSILIVNLPTLLRIEILHFVNSPISFVKLV